MEEAQKNLSEPNTNNIPENSEAALTENSRDEKISNNNTNSGVVNNSANNNVISPKNINEKLDFLYNSGENAEGQNMEAMGDMENLNGETADEENEDLFEGDYEEFEERSLYGDQDYQPTIVEDYSTIVTNRRTELFKIIITRTKRDFEASVTFNDKGPGEEGNGNNLDFKPVKANEFPSAERAVIEMGFQTSNEAYEKSYQVPRMRMQNALTQVEKGLGDIIDKFEKKVSTILNDREKMISMENFLHKVRSRMEEALQSNETIDIFQNDFELSRIIQNDNALEKKAAETQVEVRSFRDNILAGLKSKKEKSINHIRIVKNDCNFIAHSLLRNLTFEERAKIIGIPYQSQILFWDFVDPEVNSQIFSLEIPMEITCFEFCPTNENQLVSALISGQLIIYEFKDLMGILSGKYLSEHAKKMKKESMYTYYITPIFESHKTHINAMKWFPKNFSFTKYNLVQNNSGEHTALATLGEDGQVLIWDMKGFDRSHFNDTSNYIKPVIRCEINKMDYIAKISGTGMQLNINLKNPLIHVATDEGQVYSVDWTIKPTPENLCANVKKIYSNRYFRPVLGFEFSPFYENIFLTVHDYHFCLWAEGRAKPIFMSPNLDKSYYTAAKFSPSRPSVIYVSRNNGAIDIWDFLDESHKPSVTETFVKEQITFLEIFQFFKQSDDNISNKSKNFVEYFAIGDIAGQLTIMEVPKLFSEKATDEERLMYDILENEIKRQEYMEMRYKVLDEDQFKPDIDELSGEKREHKEDDINLETELKYLEDAFLIEKIKLLTDLGVMIQTEQPPASS